MIRKLLVLFIALFFAVLPVVSYSATIPVYGVNVETGAVLTGELLMKNASRVALAPFRFTPVGAAVTAAPVLYDLYSWLMTDSAIANTASYLEVGTAAAPGKYQIPVTAAAVPISAANSGPITGLTADQFTQVFPIGQDFPHNIPTGNNVLTLNFGMSENLVVGINTRPDYLCLKFSSVNSDYSGACHWMVNENGAYFLVADNSANPALGPMLVAQVSNPAYPDIVDGNYRFKKSTEGYAPDLTDPDWKTAAGMELARMFPASGAPVSISGVDSAGVTASLLLAPTPTGVALRNTYIKPTSNLSNTEAVTSTVVFDPAGLSSAETTTAKGFNGAVAEAIDTTAVKSVVQVQFPDDYARQTSLESIDGNVQASNSHLAGIYNALTAESVSPNDPEADESALKQGFFSGTFDDLTSWQLPAHSSACPTGSFEAFGRFFVIDAHCALINDNFSLFRDVMHIVFMIAALFIVLGA